MKKYWKYSKEQLRDVFSTTEQGLSEMQVKEIRETCGENILEEGKRPGLLRVFLSQFADLLIVILLIAGAVSGAGVLVWTLLHWKKRRPPLAEEGET